MSGISCRVFAVVSLLSLLSGARTVLAVKPAEQLLPATTKAFVSVPSVEELRSQFDETQIGQLANDEVMKPFADDLRRQLRDRLGKTNRRLGINWEDFEGVYAGEACLALIQPDNDKTKHAIAMLVDVTNHDLQLEQVLKKIDEGLKSRKATIRQLTIGSVQVTDYELPKEAGELEAHHVVLFSVDSLFVATDNVEVGKDIIRRTQEDDENTLAQSPDFVAVMSRVAESSQEMLPQLRWYVEPFGYVEVVRAAAGGRKKRGTDMLTILQHQGFDAVKAVGGHINLATGEHDLLHRTFVLAPRQATDGDKYRLAARMLDFPNQSHPPLNWVPRELATFLTFNWKMKEAFEHSVTLVDEVVDNENFFNDVLESIKTDPNGPQIDIRRQMVAHLGERAMLISDYQLPISPKSERMLFALEITDPERVTVALQKVWGADPQARPIDVDGRVIWEIIKEEEDLVPDLEISLGPPGQASAVEEEEQHALPNSAMTVAHGHLLVATHVDFLASVLNVRPTIDTLDECADYQQVNQMLEELGAGQDSFRFFSRTDEAYRGTYELVRQGKMPESKSLLGRILNRLLGPEEQGVLREQQIDGKNLPEYQVVRRHLGPAGLFVRSEEDGWFVTGIMLNKHQVRPTPRAPLTTAAMP